MYRILLSTFILTCLTILTTCDYNFSFIHFSRVLPRHNSLQRQRKETTKLHNVERHQRDL